MMTVQCALSSAYPKFDAVHRRLRQWTLGDGPAHQLSPLWRGLSRGWMQLAVVQSATQVLFPKCSGSEEAHGDRPLKLTPVSRNTYVRSPCSPRLNSHGRVHKLDGSASASAYRRCRPAKSPRSPSHSGAREWVEVRGQQSPNHWDFGAGEIKIPFRPPDINSKKAGTEAWCVLKAHVGHCTFSCSQFDPPKMGQLHAFRSSVSTAGEAHSSPDIQ
jgi:hypothetical protein